MHRPRRVTTSTTLYDRVQSAPEKSVSIPPPPTRSERRAVPADDARAWLDPAPGKRSHRLADAALVAGALLAIGVGRFGTYDALAGAAFMCGVALILPGRAGHRWFELLGGVALLFVGFLAK